MPHHTSLIATIVAGLGLAFIFGLVAQRLRLSPLVGYLVAGVLIGPFTPGYVADQQLAPQLAEIGVILLMFGVGLHFSLADLISVRAVALPGAVAQMAIATLLGMGLAWAMGWSLGAGLVFGLALSVASTVVLLRALQSRRLIETEQGRIAVGWLIVEDLAMVITLVLLPATAPLLGGRADAAGASTSGLAAWFGAQTVWAVLGWTLLKVAIFVGLMLVVGRRLIPWVLHYVAHTGSRELFRLAVLAIALGLAFGSAELFGVSFALGAFFAGMLLAESPLSQQAANETLPLRDAFAVLFFVSVGMLFDPSIIVREPLPVLATLLIIVLGKSLAALGIMRVFGHSLRNGLTIAASLAQIGEFSFILAGLGMNLGLLPQAGNDLILAGALLSIVLNPFLFAFVDRFSDRLRKREDEEAAGAPPLPSEPQFRSTNLTGHAVLVGYGRVGRLIERALQERGIPLLVIDERAATLETLRSMGVEVFVGQANEPELLKAVNLARARWLISAIPNPFEASNLIEAGRKANPRLTIIARAHSDAEVEHLKRYGADRIVLGEQEIALEMTRLILQGTDAEAVDGDAFSQVREADKGDSTGSGSDTPDPRR
jgi:CPA2 family monovalent cation:H+ antiporter-2